MNSIIALIEAHQPTFLLGAAFVFVAFGSSLPDPADLKGKSAGEVIYAIFRNFVRALMPLADRRINPPQATVGPVDNSTVVVTK